MIPLYPLLFLTSLTSATVKKIVLPKPPRIPDPDPIIPNPIPQPNPVLPGPGYQGPAGPEAAIVQANIGRLEQQLHAVQVVVDVALGLASAILATSATTATATATATEIDDVGISTITPTITSTPTINPTLFFPCKSYAQILTSCLSSTPTFLSLPPSQQASCACYTASTSYGPAVCTAVISRWDASYDSYEADCWRFFDGYGYQSIASAMDAATGLPGAMLCATISAVGSRNGNGNASANLVLERTSVVGSCRATALRTVAPVREESSGGERVALSSWLCVGIIVVGMFFSASIVFE